MKNKIHFTTLVSLILLSACGGVKSLPPELYLHSIVLNDRGDLVLPQHLHDDIYIAELVDKIKAQRQQGKRDVLIYIHGGMVPLATSIADAQVQIPQINHEGRYYPIYISWDSSMLNAYGDHLFSIRQGEKSDVLGPLSSPFYLLADLGRAVTRAPVTWGFQGHRSWQEATSDDILPESVDRYNDSFLKDNKRHITLGTKKDFSFWRKSLNLATGLVPGVLRLVTTPVVDAVGKASWHNMLRRTEKLFLRDIRYSGVDVNNIDAHNQPGYGTLYKMLQALEQAKLDIDVTLIGHSMGAIVATKIVHYFPHLNYRRIVFMAGAVTIREWLGHVIPYLQKNTKTEFFNLTLHPEMDANEATAFKLVPKGSLLEWIDDFASEPTDYLDLTIGKWKNILLATSTIPGDVRPRVFIKGFGIGSNGPVADKPQKHGEFNDSDQLFWREEYWR